MKWKMKRLPVVLELSSDSDNVITIESSTEIDSDDSAIFIINSELI